MEQKKNVLATNAYMSSLFIKISVPENVKQVDDFKVVLDVFIFFYSSVIIIS